MCKINISLLPAADPRGIFISSFAMQLLDTLWSQGIYAQGGEHACVSILQDAGVRVESRKKTGSVTARERMGES